MGRAGSRAASVWAASARGGAQPWPAWSGDQPRHCTVHTYLGVGVANVVRNIGECGWCADRDAPPGVTMRELCGGAGGGGAACSDLARPSLGWAGLAGPWHHGSAVSRLDVGTPPPPPPPLQHSPAPASLCQEDVTGGGTGACWALLDRR